MNTTTKGVVVAAIALVVLFLMAPLKPKPAPEKGAATTEVIDLRPPVTAAAKVSKETRPEVVRESAIQPLEVSNVKKGRGLTTTLSEVPKYTLSAAEKYIQNHGGQTHERVVGGWCTFSILNNGSVVIHRYPETLEIQDIEEICSPYFPGYSFSNQTTFVVATLE